MCRRGAPCIRSKARVWRVARASPAALLVIQSDGRVSPEEQETIDWMASAFGIEGGYSALVEELQGASL